MTTTGIVILVIALILVAGGIFLIQFLRERSRKLRSRFGPEYHRTVREAGSTYRAEAQLDQLQRKVEKLHIRSLDPAERESFTQAWIAVQAGFVDDPGMALAQADELIRRVMAARGYPISTFEECAQEISVDHALVVQNYRAGHQIVTRQAQGKATTEDLRQAMVHYRTLFDELVGQKEVARAAYAGRL